jgi:hypothetical protein
LLQLREGQLEAHETIDFGESQGSEIDGPGDPTR